MTIKALREAMVVPGSSLTFSLDSLEKKGLLRRSWSRADRRRWLMHLTAKGQRFCFSLVERETGAVMPSLEKVSDELRAASCKIAGEISQAGAIQASDEQTHQPCLPTAHRLPEKIQRGLAQLDSETS